MLWLLTSLSTVFQLYRGSQFYWFRKPEYPEKTTDLLQVTDRFFNFLIFYLRITDTKLSFYYAITNQYFRNVQLVSMETDVIRGASVQANMDVIMWLVHVIVGQDLLDQNVMLHALQDRKYPKLSSGLRKFSIRMSNLIDCEMLNSNKICAVPLFEFVSKCNVG